MVFHKNYESANRLAHIMQASAGSIGAERLRKDLIKIVELADKKQLSNQLLTNFYSEISKVLTSISKLTTVTGDKPVPTVVGNPVDYAKVEALIPKLQQSLEQGAFEANNQMEQLLVILKGQHSELTVKLAQMIKNYEFKPAVNLLEEFAILVSSKEGLHQQNQMTD